MNKGLFLIAFVVGSALGQNYKVCIPANPTLCQSLDKDGSQVVCEPVETRVDCAIKMARGEVDIGTFSEEELMLLSLMEPSSSRVVATIRDVNRLEPYSYEAVAVVPSTHTNGFEGLRGGRYCHPGFDEQDQRWSPRVLKTLEYLSAQTDRCPNMDLPGKTAEEAEIEILNSFFSSGCRPGPWSANTTVDANLKSKYPSLCSLCGPTNPTCNAYTINMGVQIAGVSNNNRHIQALECLKNNGTVAFVAWQHVREYFMYRSPSDSTSYSVMCQDGTLRTLTAEVVNSATSPCALVRQPWSAIVASTSRAPTVLADLNTWWAAGSNPGSATWQGSLFTALAGGANARVVFEATPSSPGNYTRDFRTIPALDATSSCMAAQRWCTLSAQEQTKCNWVRNAAYSLGVQPTVSCQQRSNVLDCLKDIQEQRADFIASPSNYGYIARQHYKLSPVKLVQNSRSNSAAFSRIIALVKETTAQSDITRFENLRGKNACFPEYGGIAYVSFVRTAQQLGVLSASECDYARAVGEFFSGACAPGAVDAAHAITDTTYDAQNLCNVCKPIAAQTTVTVANATQYTCTWDWTNQYFGNNGSLACLADQNTHVAFLDIKNINQYLTSLNLQANQFRALCKNNTLASSAGVAVDDNCLLAHVVDAEVLTRRNDPSNNALNTLLDSFDKYFGYNAATGSQLINFEIFSPFDGTSDLLFRDSTVGLAEPTTFTAHEPAKNYIELFQHLESCTGAAATDFATKNIVSLFMVVMMALFVAY